MEHRLNLLLSTKFDSLFLAASSADEAAWQNLNFLAVFVELANSPMKPLSSLLLSFLFFQILMSVRNESIDVMKTRGV